jgi:hypothetical protein
MREVTGIAFDRHNNRLAVATLWGGVYLFRVWGKMNLASLWEVGCNKYTPMAVGFSELQGGTRDVLTFGYSGVIYNLRGEDGHHTVEKDQNAGALMYVLLQLTEPPVTRLQYFWNHELDIHHCLPD